MTSDEWDTVHIPGTLVLVDDQIAGLPDWDLVKRFQQTDGESEEAEMLLTEIQRRDLDL